MCNNNSDEEYQPTHEEYEQEMQDAQQEYEQEMQDVIMTRSIIPYCIKNTPCSTKSITQQMEENYTFHANRNGKMEQTDSEPEEGNIHNK